MRCDFRMLTGIPMHVFNFSCKLMSTLGFTGGGHFTEEGSAADYICLSQDPLWGVYDDTHQTYSARVYGTEYQFSSYQYGENIFGKNIQDQDVPCAVCLSSRSSVIMIPGRNQCYPGWTVEYSGYLVGGYFAHKAASNYECLDSTPEVEFGGADNLNGKLMYLTEAECGALQCPPYVQDREITCVVCSK